MPASQNGQSSTSETEAVGFYERIMKSGAHIWKCVLAFFFIFCLALPAILIAIVFAILSAGAIVGTIGFTALVVVFLYFLASLTGYKDTMNTVVNKVFHKNNESSE